MSEYKRPTTTSGNRRGRATSAPRQRPHSVHGKTSYNKRQTLKVRQYRPDFPGGVHEVESKPNFVVRPKVLNYSRWVDERQRLGRIRDRSMKFLRHTSNSSPSSGNVHYSRRSHPHTSKSSHRSSGPTTSIGRDTKGIIGGERGEVVLDRVNMDRANLREIPGIKHGSEHKSIKLLNFQYNQIAKITNLRFFPDLIFLDLYQNQIRKLGGLEKVPKLKALILGGNQIQKIEGLDHLPKLDALDLQQNRILRVEGLESLGSLRVLNLAGNRLKRVEGLAGLRSLVELNLKSNRIESMGNLTQSYFERNTPHLQRVFLSQNRIRKFSNIQCLLKGCSLTEFSLDGNPIATHPLYRNYLIEHVTTLRKIDYRKVSEEEKRIVFRKKGRTGKGSNRVKTQTMGWAGNNGGRPASQGRSKRQKRQQRVEEEEEVEEEDGREDETTKKLFGRSQATTSSKGGYSFSSSNQIRASVGVVPKRIGGGGGRNMSSSKTSNTTTKSTSTPTKEGGKTASPLRPYQVNETLKMKKLIIKSVLTDIEEPEYYRIVEKIVFHTIPYDEVANNFFVKLRKFGKLYQVKFEKENEIHHLDQLHRLSILGDRITELWVKDNPISSLPFPILRDYCIIIMPKLKLLNGEKVYEIGREKMMKRNMFDRLNQFEKKHETLGGIGGRRGIAGGETVEKDWDVGMFKEDADAYLENVLDHSLTIYRKMRIIDRKWDSVIAKIIKETIQKK